MKNDDFLILNDIYDIVYHILYNPISAATLNINKFLSCSCISRYLIQKLLLLLLISCHVSGIVYQYQVKNDITNILRIRQQLNEPSRLAKLFSFLTFLSNSTKIEIRSNLRYLSLVSNYFDDKVNKKMRKVTNCLRPRAVVTVYEFVVISVRQGGPKPAGRHAKSTFSIGNFLFF